MTEPAAIPACTHTLKTLERLRAKCAIDPTTGCWNWTAAVANNGYGRIQFEGENTNAHL